MAENLDERTRGLESMYLAMRAEMMREVKELKSELLVYKSIVLNRVIGEEQTPKPRTNVPKPKEFKGSRTAQDVFQEGNSGRDMRGVRGRIQRAFLSEECSARGSNKIESEGFFAFMDGLQHWANLEIQMRGTTELSKALDSAEAIAPFEISALMDTSASKLLLSEQVAKKLGLRVEKTNGFIKTINSKEVPIVGEAKGINLKIGGWTEKKSIKVIPLDDFNFVIGINFFDRINEFPLSFADSLVICDLKHQYIVSVSRESEVDAKMLSAIQLSKGVHREEPIFVASLVGDEPTLTKEVPNKVGKVLVEFRDVMSTDLSKCLPPKREVDHKIELVSNVEPLARAPYRMVPSKLEELHRQLKELLDTGARWFTKLDLRSGYYQVRIAKGDEPKTACVMRYSLNEFLVMPFGLINAPATFCMLMNNVLQPFLDRFIVVYLDNIMVYSKTLEEHVENLRRVIDEWKPPTKATELREFLGLANYYRWLMKCYSKIATPLTKLLKKDKSFIVFIDASNVAIDRVLIQEEHPVIYESWKLNEIERRYSIHEKEMTAVAHCQEFLAKLDFSMKYKPGKVNCVADGLSRRYAIETVEGTLLERIKEGLPHDHVAEIIIDGAKEGRTKEFWLERWLIYYRGHRLIVPRYGKLRKELMRECHDSKWAGHSGVDRILALFSNYYYRPHITEDVQVYVKTCLVCQQDKIEAKKPMGLLQTLPIPKRPWESISMDFINGLLKTDGLSSIMVVVNRFLKYVTFIIAFKDTQFTRRLWKELFKLIGSRLNFSTIVHPQIDGQTELVNALIEIYLRHYATNQSLFEIVTGQQPLKSNTVVTKYMGPNPSAHKVAKEWHECAQGLLRKYEGPFRVIERVGTMAYKLELPPTIRAHHMIHVILVKSYYQDVEDSDRGHYLRHEYFVMWKGQPKCEGSWEHSDGICQFKTMIDQFHARRVTRVSPKPVGPMKTDPFYRDEEPCTFIAG
ncbi:hypothetical protein F3Y22_tig00002826pilonHSYRG00003 [Hibiscus syriacus]|uniref:RNA-directed DNA polymerase n=1 Tax=Hibiscus syriacus TaxID=106335 RepID=A0A6A3CWC6_HIBSY|nr:hypothetical protein F3Y22_tig00002826pilonHSYRG00003 [Hibiscus syriacus]